MKNGFRKISVRGLDRLFCRTIDGTVWLTDGHWLLPAERVGLPFVIEGIPWALDRKTRNVRMDVKVAEFAKYLKEPKKMVPVRATDFIHSRNLRISGEIGCRILFQGKKPLLVNEVYFRAIQDCELKAEVPPKSTAAGFLTSVRAYKDKKFVGIVMLIRNDETDQADLREITSALTALGIEEKTA